MGVSVGPFPPRHGPLSSRSDHESDVWPRASRLCAPLLYPLWVMVDDRNLGGGGCWGWGSMVDQMASRVVGNICHSARADEGCTFDVK